MLWRCAYRITNALRFSYLCVSTHDLAGLLVEGLTVPLWVYSLQPTSQAVMLTHKQRVNRCQSDVLIHALVT